MKIAALTAIKNKPVEFICSIAMIGAGVYFSGTGAAGSMVVVAGNFLSALGGVLLSWSAASISSKEAAAEILRPQLAAVGRQLVTVSGQISKAVNDARNGELDTSVALEMVSQASKIMYASVNEIHVVLNQRVESQELLETAQRVEDLATKLAGSPASDHEDVESELKDAVAELRTQVQNITARDGSAAQKSKLIPKATPQDLETLALACPSCSSQTSVNIGRAFGSSAMPKCSSCGIKFHAHRAHKGAVFTNLPGGYQLGQVQKS